MVKIGSNIASLQAQRRLSEASSNLSRSYERLSSGQRINRASDDAAGLAIAGTLDAGKRIYTQGVRNLNDGISALQVADSTIANLSQIVTRIRELAEQAANGAFSSVQRKAIDKEAAELKDEYFRISKETSFNGIKIFDGSLQNGLRLQSGLGTEGSVQSSLGGVMGNGAFAQRTSYTAGNGPMCSALGDVNGDGIPDIVTADQSSGTVSILAGQGDGTFSARSSYAAGSGPYHVTLGDFNNDGALDIVTANSASDSVNVLIGKGDGTFLESRAYTWGNGPNSVALGDLNGDGVLDIVAPDSNSSTVGVIIGKGDGTFLQVTSYTTEANPWMAALGDLNADGILDIVTTGGISGKLSVLMGKGDGTFSPKTCITVGSDPWSLALGDLNGDRILDIVSASNAEGTASIFLGKGNGTFNNMMSAFVGGNPTAVTLGDLNGDGVLDMVTADGIGKANVQIGKGDGTFYTRTGYVVGNSPASVTLGDLNEDGVLDIVTANWQDNKTSILLGRTREGIAPLLPFSLATQAEARQALAPLDRKLNQLSAQRGTIGAFQSRLHVALNTAQSASDNYETAESRIRDADIASEAAEATRLKISLQAATAVLAQANQQPALAVKLLR